MEKKEMVLTSVKIPSDLFDDFKVASVRLKFSLQKLVERSMVLYLENEEFRKQLHSFNSVNYKSKFEE
jgi:regulator of replication initiation timing